tara:strand:+ start:1687 stop:2049 length:363 start_codon:yes stop_codon:yes gene_type:complete
MVNKEYDRVTLLFTRWWYPKNQSAIRIKNMTHDHLKNAIKWWHNRGLGSTLAISDRDSRWRSKKRFAIKELSIIKYQIQLQNNNNSTRCTCWMANSADESCDDCEQLRELESWNEWGDKS